MFSFENKSDHGHMLYLDDINISTVTGIVNEAQKSISVNIYPNPNNGSFTLSIHSTDNANGSLEISNMVGQLIYTEKLNEFSGDYTKHLDLTKYGSGVYFVSLIVQDNKVTKKVIVY
jgi:hypothetical protein